MKIRYECLLAHSYTVKVSRAPAKDFEFNQRGQLHLFSNKNKFISLQGPGLVYIDMQAGNRFFKEVQMSLFVVLLYCCLYLLMFLIVTVDKFEDHHGQGAGGAANAGGAGNGAGGQRQNIIDNLGGCILF